MTAVTTIIEPLTPAESVLWGKYDAVVKAGVGTFWAVYEALGVIREKRLFRNEYTSFDAYCRARLDRGEKRISQLIIGAETQKSTTVEIPNEATARELRKQATQLTGGDKTQVDAKIDQLAQAASGLASAAGRPMNSNDVKAAASAINGDDPDRRAVYGTNMALVIQWMNQGVLTPKAARELTDALQGCEPRVRGDLLRLQIKAPAVVRKLNQLARGKHESYDELVMSGCLQFADGSYTPVAAMSFKQLTAWLDEKAEEHRRRGAAERDAITGIKEVSLSLWIGDPDRSVDALKTMLGEKNAVITAVRLLRSVGYDV